MQPTRVRAIIEHQGKFLLVRNRSSAAFWSLPGGKVDPGEDIITALKREIIEEMGVKPQMGNLVYVHQFGATEKYGAPEFFFHITNGADFANLDLSSTTHGRQELAECAFKDPRDLALRPTFLRTELPELAPQQFDGFTRVRIGR